jgi:endonuclease V-like protein UPF0215 family
MFNVVKSFEPNHSVVNHNIHCFTSGAERKVAKEVIMPQCIYY